ncbi:MAG: heterodisulfide reductase, partial [Desulfosarcinaceae bacterium]
GLLLKMVGVDWLNFAPTGDHLWGSSYINNYLVDIIMIPTFTAAIVIFGLGLKRFIAAIHANALAEGKTDQEKIDPAGFVQALIKTIPTILKHNKFNECGDNADRATPHMMVFFGFLALFIVTACFFLAEWVFHIEGPYSQINPIKWLGNLGGLGVIIGGLLLLKKRISDEATTYWDWYLVGLVLALGITGLFTELLRLGGAFGVMAIVYYIHLILVWSLFAYTPFSKLAHIVYRTVAMSYQEYSGRK